MTEATARITVTSDYWYNDPTYERSYAAWMRWEDWFRTLRTFLHEEFKMAHSGVTGTTVLNDFYDAYGTALMIAGRSEIFIDFAESKPSEPMTVPPHIAQDITEKERAFSAALKDEVDFPSERLPAVAVALRSRAAVFIKLAETIEAGEFAFPSA